MSISIASSTRTFFESLRPTSARSLCKCIQAGATAQQSPRQRRNVSTAPARASEMEVDAPSTRQRWAQTPPRMKGNIDFRRQRTVGGRHDVNKDPRKLNQMYSSFLGPGGDQLLSDETRWLAVTHKSFDHGRRGFNDRLAFLGKRIVEMQHSIERVRYMDIEKLTAHGKALYLHHMRIAAIAEQHGIPEVSRWVPRDPNNLTRSGAYLVYAQAVYAIIGALALEQGGDVANRICRERVLVPLLHHNQPDYDRTSRFEA